MVTAELLLLALVASVLNIVLTTLITGRDSLVYLRYFLSIMAGGALLLRMLNQPVLPYLENLMLGIGAMQGIGRIGCLKVGCCYGKPARFGIRYTSLHARAGFPRSLVGVTLFPVQLLESFWVLSSAGIGIWLASGSNPYGYGISSYIILFSSGRFCFELLRGDRARPYLAGFSEAQWIPLAMVCGIVIMEMTAILPFYAWHMIPAGMLILLWLALLILHPSSSRIKLKDPATIHELAKTLSLFEKGRNQHLSGPHAVHLRAVHKTLQLSDGVFLNNHQRKIHHYTLSYSDRPMAIGDAVVLANMIQSWHPQEEKSKLIKNDNHSYHLLRYQTIES